MNRVPVRIIIFPLRVDINRIPYYDVDVYGDTLSDLSEIRVNRVNGGYTILYKDAHFRTLDPLMFGNSIIELFNNNLPNTVIKLELYYFYMDPDMFDEKCGKNLVKIDDFFSDCDNPLIEYEVTVSMENLVDYYDADNDEFDFDRDDVEYWNNMIDESDDDYDDDDDYIYDDDDDEPFRNLFSNNLYDDDDDYDDYDRPRKKKRRKSYNQSKLITGSSKAKRNIKRHNFIISSDKNLRKKDEKIIKQFLKDFIPGDSKWMRAYRSEILKRWMTMYVVTKKEAKILEKAHKDRMKENGNGGGFDRDVAVNMTRHFFQKFHEPFYDPNR